jgi:hypothetical protein
MLTATDGKPLIGVSTAFDPRGADGNHRFDPEGLRLGPSGSVFISDEYGPYIYEFDSSGHQVRALNVPARYSIAHPAATKEEEVERNQSGRVANAGFESLAISPNGKRLYALIQLPLIQDSKRTQKGKVKGLNCRLLEIDIASGATREFLYPLEHEGSKTSEMLALDDHRFLVIERDNQIGQNAGFKKIMKIDVAGASDISAAAQKTAQGRHAGPQVCLHRFARLAVRSGRAATGGKARGARLGTGLARRAPAALDLCRQRLQTEGTVPVLRVCRSANRGTGPAVVR